MLRVLVLIFFSYAVCFHYNTGKFDICEGSRHAAQFQFDSKGW